MIIADYYERSTIAVIPRDSPPPSATITTALASSAALGISNYDDDGSSDGGSSVSVECYLLKRFHPKLRLLPFLDCYRSDSTTFGAYVPPKDRPRDGSYSVKADVRADL